MNARKRTHEIERNAIRAFAEIVSAGKMNERLSSSKIMLFFAVKDRKQLSTQFHGTTSELRRATLVSMETLKVRYSRA